MNKIIIEKNNLINNILYIKNYAKKTNKDGVEPVIIAVLKHNGYGISMPILAKYLIQNGINYFAVSDVYEAIELKKVVSNASILVLNATSVEDEIKLIIENDFVASVGSIENFRLIDKLSKENNKVTRCHINIDTGMSRFGLRADELLKTSIDFEENSEAVLPIDLLVQTIKELTNVRLEGIYTHFQQAYENSDRRTIEQFNSFVNVLNRLKDKGINYGMAHCCNSSAFIKYPYMHLDAVRIGSAFTGRLQIAEKTELKRVGYLESQICEIRNLKKGDRVFYSGMYEAKSSMKIGVVEAGYGEGFELSGPKDNQMTISKFRNIKNAIVALFKDTNIYVTIHGKRAKVLGRIGVKNFVCDLSNIDDAKVGDKVRMEISIVLCDSNIPREEV